MLPYHTATYCAVIVIICQLVEKMESVDVRVCERGRIYQVNLFLCVGLRECI